MAYKSLYQKRANRLINRAEATRSPAERIIRSLCTHASLSFSRDVIRGPQKTQDRIIEKAHNDYNGDFNRITDATRYMLLFNDAAKIPVLQTLLIAGQNSGPFHNNMNRSNIEFYSTPKDFFYKPKRWGYMGFLIKFAPNDNQKYAPFELQITSRPMQEQVYPMTHDMYERVRTKIEEYDKTGLRPTQWDDDTKSTVRNILRLHYHGANAFGLLDYAGNFPTIGGDSAIPDDPEDEITKFEM